MKKILSIWLLMLIILVNQIQSQIIKGKPKDKKNNSSLIGSFPGQIKKWPKPSQAYMDLFNQVKDHQLGIIGSNYYGKQEITTQGAIRGYNIEAWYPEPNQNGKAFKECLCGKLAKFSIYEFNDPFGNWDDGDVNFKVIGNDSLFRPKFILGDPPASIRARIDFAVNLLKNRNVPVNGGFTELQELTGGSAFDQFGRPLMGWEVDIPGILKQHLNPNDPIQSEFQNYKVQPVQICGYGAYVRDILHPLGIGRPELHPLEQFWWRVSVSGRNDDYGLFSLALLNDKTGRFTYGGSKPVHKIPLDGVFAFAFEATPRNPLSYDFSASLASHVKDDYQDGRDHYLIDGKDTLVRVHETSLNNNKDYYDITFDKVTKDESGVVRGFIVSKSRISGIESAQSVIERLNIDVDKLKKSFETPLMDVSLLSPVLDTTRFYKDIIKGQLRFEGCSNNDVIGDLLNGRNLNFVGGLLTQVRKSSLKKVTVQVTIESIKRLHNNSYRGTANINGEEVTIHQPVNPPKSFDENSVYIKIQGPSGTQSKFIKDVNVDQISPINLEFSSRDYISKPSLMEIKLSDQEVGYLLGYLFLSIDPTWGSGERVMPSQLVWEQSQFGKRPDNNLENENEDSENETQTIILNLFEIKFRVKLLNEVVDSPQLN